MSKPTIIAISGHAQNGKDTCAQMFEKALKDKGKRVLVAHYADLLKYICKQFFNWDGKKDEAGRTLLQHVGTEVVREKYPDFWVDFIRSILTLFPNEWDYVIIPDTRFPNELSGGKYAGAFKTIHVRVTRTDPSFESPLTREQQTHPSETALDGYEYDYLVENNILKDTWDRVESIVNEIIERD